MYKLQGLYGPPTRHSRLPTEPSHFRYIMAVTERGRWLNVWMIIFTVLLTASFVGRYCSYRIQKRGIRGDDVFVVISFVCFRSSASLNDKLTYAGQPDGNANLDVGDTRTPARCSCNRTIARKRGLPTPDSVLLGHNMDGRNREL